MTGPSDFNDLAAAKGQDAVRAAIDGAAAPKRPTAEKVIPLRGQHQHHREDATGGDPGGTERPTIVCVPGELPAVVDQAEAAIMAMPGEPRIFQRGGVLVRIVRRSPTSARNLTRAAGSLAIVPFDVPGLVELMTAAANWLRPTRSKDGEAGYRTINAPHEAAAVLLARNAWQFPPLTAVLEAPTLRPDGSVLSRPGYDPKTGIFLDIIEASFDPIPEKPVRTAALAGLDQVVDLLKDFPFATDVDRSVAVTLLLTCMVRKSISGAPMFGASANTMGTGKTLIANVGPLLACGRTASVLTPPNDAAAEQKVLFTAFMEGDDFLLIDNYERQVSSDFLCAALTSETMKDRVLGLSKTVVASTAATIVVSGNNLVVAGDLSARTLIGHLDAKTDHPEHRRFTRDLMEYIPKERGRLVPAALTFLRGFITSGEQPDMEPWQRFPEWDRLIRAAVVWAGLPDPLLALRQGEANDPRRLEHQAVMETWHEAFGDKATAVREAVKVAASQALIDDHRLFDALLEVAGERGEINLRKLGRWLAKMNGRIQGGMQIARGSVVCGNQTWKVVRS